MSMTPMKKMQGVFKEFNEVAKKITQLVELHGQDRKYNYRTGTETKGVESDFIRIYKDSSNRSDEGDSVAFAFNNYKEDIDNTQVVISIISNQAHASVHMTLMKFNEKFKEFFKLVKILSASDMLTFPAFMNTARSVFGVNKSEEVDYKAIMEKMIELIEPEITKHEKAMLAVSEAETNRRTVEREVSSRVRAFEKQVQEELNYPDLLKKEGAAKAKVEKIKDQAIKNLNDRVTKVHDLYKFLTYRALKNSLTKSLDPMLKAKSPAHFSFWKNVFERVLINHQGHKD